MPTWSLDLFFLIFSFWSLVTPTTTRYTGPLILIIPRPLTRRVRKDPPDSLWQDARVHPGFAVFLVLSQFYHLVVKSGILFVTCNRYSFFASGIHESLNAAVQSESLPLSNQIPRSLSDPCVFPVSKPFPSRYPINQSRPCHSCKALSHHVWQI